MLHKKLNKKFGLVTNVRTEKGRLKFDKFEVINKKKTRLKMETDLARFLNDWQKVNL